MLDVLDKTFIKLMFAQSDGSQDSIASELQLVACKGNADYLTDLQKRMGVKDLMQLALKILETHTKGK